MSKYGNQPTICPLGHKHRSKLESSVCAILLAQRIAGYYTDIVPEVSIYLTEARIKYVVDFACRRSTDHSYEYVEAKGVETQRFKMIKQLWPIYAPTRLTIYKGTASRPVVSEVIEITPSST